MRRSIPVVLVVLLAVLGACVAPTPVQVEKPVVQTVEVEKSVVQTVEVVRTVEVEKEKPKLTIWFADDVSEVAQQWQEKMIYQFGVENNVQVVIFHEAADSYQTKVKVAIESGTLPDVWSAFENQIPGYMKAGAIGDVTDIMMELNKQGGGWVEGAIENNTHDGKIWNIPFNLWADATYVRKDLLDAKGLKIPTTFEELQAVAIALSDPKEPLCGYGMQLGPALGDSNFEIHTLLWSFGGKVWDKDSKTVALNSPETLQAIQYLKKGWDAGAYCTDAVNWDDYGNNACYLGGTCAIIQNGGSVVRAMKESDPELLKNTVTIPDVAGPAGRHNMTNYESWVMSAKPQNLEIAKKFLLYFFNSPNRQKYMQLEGGQYFPYYKDARSDPMWADPYLIPFVENGKYSHVAGWPGENTFWSQEALNQGVLVHMFTRVLVENQDPQKSIDQAVKELEAIRDSFQTK